MADSRYYININLRNSKGYVFNSELVLGECESEAAAIARMIELVNKWREDLQRKQETKQEEQ